jgi:hypothetical protein
LSDHGQETAIYVKCYVVVPLHGKCNTQNNVQ